MKKLSERSAAENLGTDRLVSINDLVDIVARIADKRIRKRYDLTKPQGVRGRNSDNTRLRQLLGWEPQTPLGEGLRITYEWIRGELIQGCKLKPAQATALSAEQSCGAATS
jgi:nucleoside-diphosphate-sugar epimerase